MAFQIQNIKREFRFESNGKIVILDDVNPNMTAEDVMNFYANIYPELTTSSIRGPEIELGKAIYTFKTTLGTKG